MKWGRRGFETRPTRRVWSADPNNGIGTTSLTDQFLSIPSSTSLRRPSGWDKVDGRKHTYGVIRHHFALVDRQDGPLLVGDRLSAHKGTQDHFTSIETEHAAIDIHASVETHLRSIEALSRLSSSFAAPLETLGVGIKAELTQTVREQIETSTSLEQISSRKEKSTFSVTYKIAKDSEKPRVVVSVYEPRVIDVYLEYSDYLVVEYRRAGPLRLRRTRHKVPPHDGKTTIAPNELVWGIPVASFHYFRLLPSCYMMFDSDFHCEVPDPLEIRCHPIENPRQHPAPRAQVPSLYKLSNRAFPRLIADLDHEEDDSDEAEKPIATDRAD
jgi:hypothetical protein